MQASAFNTVVMRVLFHQIIEIIKLVYVSTLVEVTQQLLYAKTSVDVVADNSAYIETLFTISSTTKQLCVKECVEKTNKKANLMKYHIDTAKCFCFFATDDFYDSRNFASILDDATFFVDRKLLENKRYLSVCDFTLTPEHASQISSNQRVGQARDECLDLAESVATSEFPALYCPHEMICGLNLVPANTSELLTLSKKSCNVFVANISSCDTLFEQLVEADVDECLVGDNVCGNNSGTCKNLINHGYTCSCFPGYHKVANWHTGHFECQDVDECQNGHHDCQFDMNEICVNKDGSFQCGCDRLTRLAVIDASSSAKYDQSDDICCFLSYSYDENNSTLFATEDTQTGWALYEINEALVWTVRVQNRADCCAERMMNNVVHVCRETSSCNKCGTFEQPIGQKQWGEMSCYGARGRFVKIAATNTILQIADVEIYGTNCNLTTQIAVVDTSSSPKHNRNDAICCFLTYLLDKNDRTYFITSDSKTGWVKLSITNAHVWTVFVQNRADCCAERMMDNVVLVCANELDTSCVQCGAFVTPVGQKQWGEMACDGLLGRFVKIAATRSYLQITEVAIYGIVE